jgi:hypothetical protein
MRDKTLTEHLDFLIAQGGQDEAIVLAQALRAGVEAMYQEALAEAYLLGKVTRDTALRDLGAERLAEIEHQRGVLRRDVEWGLKGA